MMKELDDNFKLYLNSLKGVNLALFPPAGGMSTFLLETANYMAFLNKKVLFVVDNYFHQIERIENKELVFCITPNDFEKVLSNQEFMNNFDYVLIDNLEHLILNNRIEQEVASGSRYCSKLFRMFNNYGCSFLIGKIPNRINYNNGLSTGSAYISNSIIQMSWQEDRTKFLLEIIKHRFSNFKNLVFEGCVPKGEILEIFKNIGSVKNKFFNEEIAYIPEVSIFKSLNTQMNNSLFEYLNSFPRQLSKKQTEKIKEIIYKNKTPNFFFLNTIHLMKNTYHEFNIDDFINEKINFRTINQTISSKNAENLISLFLTENISYRRSLTLLKNYNKDEYGLDLLITIGISYDEIRKKLLQFKEIGNQDVVNFISTKLNSLNFKKKNFVDILLYLEEIIKGISLFVEKEKFRMMEYKQKSFFEKNKDNILLNIPVDIKGFNKGSNFFNNCVSSPLFLERFLTSSDLLFFIKGKTDYCVHINENKEIVEVKKKKNEHLTEKELKEVNKIIKMINL